ncbi:MAG: hypothetical protein ABIE55_01560 [Candidatus Aenigmatarchaeota archaeon]
MSLVSKRLKGSSGAVKGAIVLLTLAFIVASVSYVIPALAVHSSSAVISPEWVIPSSEYTFTINVTHTYVGGDAIREVRIYNNTPGHEGFVCGVAPSGWWLIDQTGTSNYCQYQTNTNWLYYDDFEDFTFKATMIQAECTLVTCSHLFRTSTIDIKEPQGELFYNLPEVKVDCFDPITTKTYGDPKKLLDEHWINSSTPITLTATDNKDCDSGVDYIKYRYCLDSGCYEGEPCDCRDDPWTTVDDYTDTFTIPEDSEHCIEFYAVDNVGNDEKIKSQCVFVDNQPPYSVKEVGDPKLPQDIEEEGSGDAGWSTEGEYNSPTHSAKLYVANGGNDWAGVDIEVDKALKDITELSFWEKVA